MGPKIPLHCIISDSNNKEINNITCLYCNGVFYDPVLSIPDNQIFCKDCFYRKYKYICDNNRNLDIDNLYKKVEKEALKHLNNFKFYCPLCLKHNLQIYNKVEYNYYSLIRHLTDCENNIIYQEVCPNYNCSNNLSIYLKDIDKKELLSGILLNNNMLEKEIQNQKSTINDIEYQKFLESKTKKENEINSSKNNLLNKKRKHESSESKNKKNNSEQKITNGKNKNSERKSIKKVEKNNDRDEQSTKKKEIANNNNNKTFSICPHLTGNYKKIFSCCNKGYGCVKCHLNNETHQIIYSQEEQCLICKIIFIGDKCPFCLVNKIMKIK